MQRGDPRDQSGKVPGGDDVEQIKFPRRLIAVSRDVFRPSYRPGEFRLPPPALCSKVRYLRFRGKRGRASWGRFQMSENNG